MASFRLIEAMPGVLWVEVQNPRLAAAIRALDYAWSEEFETPERTEALITAVERLYDSTVTPAPTPTPS